MAEWTLHNVDDVETGADIDPEPFLAEWCFGIIVLLMGLLVFYGGYDMGRRHALMSPACGTDAAPTSYSLPVRQI